LGQLVLRKGGAGAMIWMTPPRGAKCYRTAGAAPPPRRLREDFYGRYNQKARMLVERAEGRAVLVRLAKWTKVRSCRSWKTN
jgi:hypothetical protein